MASRYVSPTTKEHAQELYDLGLLMMNQDTTADRSRPSWCRAEKHIPKYFGIMYTSNWVPSDVTQYVKEDIGYLLED